MAEVYAEEVDVNDEWADSDAENDPNKDNPDYHNGDDVNWKIHFGCDDHKYKGVSDEERLEIYEHPENVNELGEKIDFLLRAKGLQFINKEHFTQEQYEIILMKAMEHSPVWDHDNYCSTHNVRYVPVTVPNYYELCRLAIINEYNAIAFINKPPYEYYELAIEKGYSTKHISKIKRRFTSEQYEKLCDKAVQVNGFALRFIKNPTRYQQETAIVTCGAMIRYMENPPLEFEIMAIRDSLWNLKYIKNQQRPEIKEVIRDTLIHAEDISLRYMDNITEEEIRLAIDNRPDIMLDLERNNLQFIDDDDFKQKMMDLYEYALKKECLWNRRRMKKSPKKIFH